MHKAYFLPRTQSQHPGKTPTNTSLIATFSPAQGVRHCSSASFLNLTRKANPVQKEAIFFFLQVGNEASATFLRVLDLSINSSV